ncbi:MAG TPA: phage tail tube protein [Rhizomicrobium sp.]|jgi:predicted secreted protein|nr:phage tail tube protein [Rhizomicrobium sp.]
MALQPSVSQYGKDTRLYIGDGASTEAFNPIGGETSLSWKRSSDDIDLSSKDDGQYKSGSYGQQSITFTVQGNVKLPDVGLQAASDTAKSVTPERNIQLKRGAVVIYSGRVGIGNFSAEFPKDGSATYSFDMKNVGAPAVDDLGAAA